MYSVTYNNNWDLCYGYMTTCMKAKDMEKWYKNAAERKDNPKVKIDHKQQKDAKEAIWTLFQCYNHLSYYTCSCKPGSTYPLPNTKRTPDVVVAILPEDNKSIKPTTSRAVRSPANGMPADPEAEVNWISAYNKFHANLSKFVHNLNSLLGQGQF